MRLLRSLLTLIAGGLLPLAFAPVHLWWLAFISPTFLLLVWQRQPVKIAFWYGWLFGLGFFGIGSSWVYISIHHFGNANTLVSSIITIGFVALLSLFPALQGWLLKKVWGHRSAWAFCLFAFPATWVLFEYLRSFTLDGFPFLFLGYSQLNTWLGGFAPIVGVYGVSCSVLMICGAISLLIQPGIHWVARYFSVVIITALTLGGMALHNHHWTRPVGQPKRVSLIQGNVPQNIKWDPNALYQILSRYRDLTMHAWQSNLIIWPEAAVPFYPSELPDYFNQLSQVATAHHSTVIVGAPMQAPHSNAVYNGLQVVGVDHGRYYKRHLVPFGEYIPLASVFGRLMSLFKIPMSSLVPGQSQQPILTLQGIPTAPFICYETAFPIEVLHAMQGKQFAINIVDDAWFGHSFAAAQQFQMTAMRALETGRYFAVTANTGITAIVNPMGRVTARLPIDRTGVLTGIISAMTGQTPLMRWGYWPLAALLLILAGIALTARRP